MSTKHAAVLLLFVVLSLAAALPRAGAADTRKQYGPWTATCASAYCTASTRIKGDAGYAYQLRVSRFQSGGQEIAFLAPGAPPAPGAPIDVVIDGKPRFTLAPDDGYRRVGTAATFVVDARVSNDLLSAMRRARRVAFAYPTSGGKRSQPQFTLDGFAAALAFADIEPAVQTTRPAPASDAPAPDAPASATPTPEPHARLPEPAGETPAPTPVAAAAQPAPARTAAPGAEDGAPTPSLAAPSLSNAQPVRTNQPAATTAGRKRTKAVQQFACRGNEPSWSLVIDHDTGRYLALAGAEPEAITLKGRLRVTGEGRTPDVDWRGKAPDGSNYRVLIQEQTCADTMLEPGSGEGPASFAYRARLTLPDGRIVQGCCNAGLETVQRPVAAQVSLDQAPVANLFGKRPDDWSRFLLELLPAIDACLQKTPGDAPYVTKAWPMNRGMVGVRTRNAVAGWFDCVAPYDGQVVEQFAAVTADAGPLPGEGYVLYTPLAHTPLAGKCWQHERVQDLAGNPLGWLSTNAC
jgi:uncharacterized membrane protein